MMPFINHADVSNVNVGVGDACGKYAPALELFAVEIPDRG